VTVKIFLKNWSTYAKVMTKNQVGWFLKNGVCTVHVFTMILHEISLWFLQI